MTLLWPGLPLVSAQQNLRQTLYLLGQGLGQSKDDLPVIQAERFTLGWNPEAPIQLDVALFDKLASPSRSVSDWQQAADLYRGDFLADFYLPDSEEFEQWTANLRAVYRQSAQDVLNRLFYHHREAENWKAAEASARRCIELDKLSENAHRHLIEVLVYSGRRQEAITHFEHYSHLLADEMGLEPELETTALVAAIRAGDFPGKASPGPTSSYRSYPLDSNTKAIAHNLPGLLTAFIGREIEQEEVVQLIAQNRLVTLTGTGGIGKTTLALQVGKKILENFPDGVWFVDLAALNDSALVPQAVMSAMGIFDQSNRDLVERLQEVLRLKTTLTLLDNCEHLLDACAQLAHDLLRSCPHLKILATSREMLGVPGEAVYELTPLPFPDWSSEETVEKLREYPALRLFNNHARLAWSPFTMTAENALFVTQICRQLDGIPLAIELAAARVNLLSVEQIAARLNANFRLLTRGSRTVLPRHKTLQTSIEWSWNLLAEKEQILLRRLSVFAGGWILEAAEVVCSCEKVPEADILDLLSQLVNKSLVVRILEPGGEARYRLLETIRLFAQDRLSEAGEVEKIRHCHLDYFLQLGEQAEQEMVGPHQVVWIKRLDSELNNLRAALSWARETDAEQGLQLATLLGLFWEQRGYYREGEEWIGQLLAGSATINSTLRAKAFAMQAYLVIDLFDLDRARMLAEESLALAKSTGNQKEIAYSHYILMYVFGLHGQLEKARNHFQQSLSLYQALGDRLGIADLLTAMSDVEIIFFSNLVKTRDYLEEGKSLYEQIGNLGGSAQVLHLLGNLALWQGDLPRARPYFEQGLALNELLLNVTGIINGVGRLGEMYFRMRDFEQARIYTERSISISEKSGAIYQANWAWARLGYIFLRMGEVDRAREIFIERQRLFKEADLTIGVVYSLEGLASLAVIQAQFQKAAQLFAWADETRQKFQVVRPSIEQADVDQDIATITGAIGETALATASAEGKTLTMDQAIVLALQG